MTIEEIKRRAELYSALAEGKTIQVQNPDDKWVDIKPEKLNYIPDNIKFRIKSEPKYRPFRTKEECWNEMQKHKLFGWITNKSQYLLIACVRQWNIKCIPYTGSGVLYNRTLTFAETLEQGFTFADGTPFGIKED